MRVTQGFGHTLREVGEDLGQGWRALVRGGYLWRGRDGMMALSPLGVRLAERVLARWRAAFPWLPVYPLGREEAPGPRHEWGGSAPWPPGWRDWLRVQVRSYRDLPRLLGVAALPSPWLLWLSAGEPPPWDAWAAFWADLGLQPLALRAYEGHTVWAMPVEEGAHEALRCPACGDAALQPWAQRGKPHPPAEAPQPLQPVATPGAHTIRELCAQLGIPPERTAKAVFLTTPEGELVFAVVRGDMEVAVPKVAAALGVTALRPATPEEIRAAGAEPGYASPIGVRARVVVDDLIPHTPNLVAGANRPDMHLIGVNYGRDFQAEVVVDIAQAHPGDPCPTCGTALEALQVWPLAQGGALRQDPEVTFPGPEGKAQPLGWAVARLDLVAVLAALAVRYATPDGLAWPPGLAPWPVVVVSLRGGEAVAEGVYADLTAAGLTVLWDDRDLGPGAKLTDADWWGAPVRVVVGQRSLAQGGVEVRPAGVREGVIVPPEQVVAQVRALLSQQEERR